MRLQVLGTGSSGNAYLLWGMYGGGIQALLIDAGLSPDTILKAVGYDTSKILGCIITHEHSDHALAVRDLSRLGIKCYGTEGTAEMVIGLRSDGHITPHVRQFGGFMVQEFETEHDAKQPCGYLIRDIETGSLLLYATDTYYLKYKFHDVNYWLIECNYCNEYLDTAPEALKHRLMTSHMSLSRLLKLFNDNDLTQTKQIILCHISKDRGNAPYMVDEVRKLTRKPVSAASNGAIYNLDDEPF